MTIEKVINRADAFYPNHFTLDEKLDWCYELSCMLRSQVKKIYKSISSTSNECVLPDDISLEDVVVLQCNKVPYEKIDITDTEIIKTPGVLKLSTKSKDGVRVTYLSRPLPYNKFIFEGEITCDNNIIVLPEGGRINLLEPGDTLILFFDDTTLFKMINEIDTDSNTITLSEPIPDKEGQQNVIIKRMVDDSTECGAPFDTMYVDWLLGKFAFYQNDFEAYNQHMALFNSKLDNYEKTYKQTNPLSIRARFHSFW